jgi:glycosyltransferase involved in cell wall biosynthesis
LVNSLESSGGNYRSGKGNEREAVTRRYRVHLCYDVEGWCYHHRLSAIERYAPDTFEVTIGPSLEATRGPLEYDLVLQLCYGQTKRLRKQRDAVNPKCIIAAGFNAGWGYRGEYFSYLQEHADHVVFNNHENWEKHGRPTATSWISNGLDTDVFRITTPPEDRKPQVMWTGSKYHLQNGDVKGYAELLLPLAERLKLDGIDSDLWLVDSHGPARKTLCEMADWYNTGTVYVVASAMEGTPNPALEMAACGGVVCSTRVGNMPELIEHGINGVLVDRTLDDLHAGVKLCCERYQEMSRAMQDRIKFWGWQYRAPRYYSLFKRLIEGKP